MAHLTRTFAVLASACLAGCASSPETPPDAAGAPEAGVAAVSDSASEAAGDSDDDSFCRVEATVTVTVVNRSSYDLEVYFDGYRAGRTADGFSRTTYQVPRFRLHHTVTLNILRGGLQLGGPAYIPVEQVFCNDATLLIGAQPRQSVFYGDKLYVPQKSQDEADEGQGGDDEASPGEGADEPPEAEDGAGR